MSLPIFDYRDRIVAALRKNNRLVLEAPTGSGKSTQVPQFMLDEGFAKDGDIWVLQPRRVAARMLARRVASERHSDVGGEIGYTVRLDSKVSKETRVRYVTEGVLLRRLADDHDLKGCAAIVLDEFHERHLEGDLALARLRALQEESRSDLRIVVMSATLDAAALVDFLEPCEHIVAEGRSFLVDVEYLRKPDERRIWEVAADQINRAGVNESEGDVLVFMPGVFEIRKTIEALRGTPAARGRLLLPLHGELPPKEQDAAVGVSDQKRIIVSTNLAETSVTIDGVTVVVDCGLARMAGFDPRRGINTLLTEKISQASADQRTGRAGRTAPGRCLRAWTEHDHKTRAAQTPAEIHRLDLSEAVLSLKASGVVDLQGFRWFEPPRPDSLIRAEYLLHDLGAIDAKGEITETGQRMLRFPLHPRYARMLLEADRHKCVPQAALLAALAQGRPLLRRQTDRRMADLREDLLGGETTSDFFKLVRAWNWARNKNFDPRTCGKLGVNAAAAREAGATAEQILNAAKSAGLDVEQRKADDEALRRSILAGFVDHLAHRLDGGTLRCDMIHQRRATLARESAVRDAELFVAAEVREIERHGGEELTVLLDLATEIEEEWLKDFAPDDYHEGETVEYEPALKRVVSFRERRFHDLILARETRGEPDAELAAKALAREVDAGRISLKQWDQKVDLWLQRVAFLRGAAPELELPEFDGEEKLAVLEQLCLGASSVREIRDKPVLPVLIDWLSPQQRHALEKLAPERITLPGGRKARITYPDNAEPFVATRLQDLFGVKESPKILNGRHALLVHLLAPNQRPIQITKDLASFWANQYDDVRKELKRRYPKHAWPEDPSKPGD